jgi:hypothetical protein
MDAATAVLASVWDAGEQHPSRQQKAGLRGCYPHAVCNPHADPVLHAAFAAGCAAEESYVGMWGQFDPHGHLGNPYRYPPPPLYTDAELNDVLALHRDGVGTRKIAGRLGLKRPIVQRIIREQAAALVTTE